MKSAHTPKDVSALSQRPNFITGPTPKTELQRALADIRAAVAPLGHLAAHDDSGKGVRQ